MKLYENTATHNPPRNVYEIVEMFSEERKQPWSTVNYVIAPSQDAAERWWFEFTKSSARVADMTTVSLVADFAYFATPYYDGSINRD